MIDRRSYRCTDDVPPLRLTFDLDLPDIDASGSVLLERWRAFYAEEGRRLVDQLLRTLPGGLIDGLLLALLDHKRSIFRVAHEKATTPVVVTDYYGKTPEEEGIRCQCCPDGWHRCYRAMLHDATTDKPLDDRKLLDEALRAAGVVDGDEITITVTKTGRRPFGDRRVRYARPHSYEREPEDKERS